jgi:hypothetical protein
MVCLMYVVSETEQGRAAVVMRGLSKGDLRRHAKTVCRRRLGECNWELCSEEFRPCMVSLGGHVRLWEGRFELTRG